MKVNNSLIVNEKDKKMSFSNFLTNQFVKQKITEVVGRDSQKFMTAILSAVTNNSTLQECDQMSILNCAFLGEGLKLSPSPQLGQYYMVPFKDNKKGIKVAQFQLGYKGYIQLAIRSGQYKDIDVIEIREGEYLGRDKYTGKHRFEFIEDEIDREQRRIIGYMSYLEYLNGFTKQLFWTKEKMLNHADKYSQAFNKESYKKLKEGKISQEDMWRYSSYWYKDFDGMAFKTMLRQLLGKWGLMSSNSDIQKAYDNDMASIQDDGQPYYIENDSEQNEDKEPIEIKPEKIESNPGEVIQAEVEKKQKKSRKIESTPISEETTKEKTEDQEKNITEEHEKTQEEIEKEFFS